MWPKYHFAFIKAFFRIFAFLIKVQSLVATNPLADKTLSYNSKRNIIEDVFNSVSIIFVHKISQWGPKRYWSLYGQN